MESVLAYIYTFLIGYQLYKIWKDKTRLTYFSPITFFCIYFSYYILYPYYFSDTDIYGYAENHGAGEYTLFFTGAIINFIGIIIGFYWIKRKYNLTGINSVYNLKNGRALAYLLFAIGFIAYYSFNDFSIDLIREQDDFFDSSEHRFYHGTAYLTSLISLFPAVACLLYATKAPKVLIAILCVIVISISVISGSRVKLILFLVPFLVFIHLYPHLRKPNLKLYLPLLVVAYILMGFVEKTRNYGFGLDVDKLGNLSVLDYQDTKAHEAEYVYYFSSRTMNVYKKAEPMLWDVLGTAVFAPVPRSFFPNKPDAQYLRDANIRVLGTDVHGAAYLNIVEGYLAFGWLGVLINGLCLGWLARMFWTNYKRNPRSIGAVLFLGMFEGVSFVLISRGYLAQELTVFMYHIPIVYFISKYMGKFWIGTKSFLFKKLR